VRVALSVAAFRSVPPSRVSATTPSAAQPTSFFPREFTLLPVPLLLPFLESNVTIALIPTILVFAFVGFGSPLPEVQIQPRA